MRKKGNDLRGRIQYKIQNRTTILAAIFPSYPLKNGKPKFRPTRKWESDYYFVKSDLEAKKENEKHRDSSNRVYNSFKCIDFMFATIFRF